LGVSSALARAEASVCPSAADLRNHQAVLRWRFLDTTPNMEVIVLIGVQASGKSTFTQRQSGSTHLRISRDVVNTAHREQVLQQACFALGQPFVADNTHPDAKSRAK